MRIVAPAPKISILKRRGCFKGSAGKAGLEAASLRLSSQGMCRLGTGPPPALSGMPRKESRGHLCSGNLGITDHAERGLCAHGAGGSCRALTGLALCWMLVIQPAPKVSGSCYRVEGVTQPQRSEPAGNRAGIRPRAGPAVLPAPRGPEGRAPGGFWPRRCRARLGRAHLTERVPALCWPAALLLGSHTTADGSPSHREVPPKEEEGPGAEVASGGPRKRVWSTSTPPPGRSSSQQVPPTSQPRRRRRGGREGPRESWSLFLGQGGLSSSLRDKTLKEERAGTWDRNGRQTLRCRSTRRWLLGNGRLSGDSVYTHTHAHVHAHRNTDAHARTHMLFLWQQTPAHRPQKRTCVRPGGAPSLHRGRRRDEGRTGLRGKTGG